MRLKSALRTRDFSVDFRLKTRNAPRDDKLLAVWSDASKGAGWIIQLEDELYDKDLVPFWKVEGAMCQS